MRRSERSPAGRTLLEMLLLLCFFVTLACVVLIATGTLEAYLPAHWAGMIPYTLGGTFFFLLALRAASRSRKASRESDIGDAVPRKSGPDTDAGSVNSLDNLRRRISERKARDRGSGLEP